MTYEEAKKIAAERAYSNDKVIQAWVNKHFEEAGKKCSCSICYWRRSHITKLMRPFVTVLESD